ncbi:MAG: ABC transporter ATP-binding protein [Cytophagaceae bacterium]
MAFLTISGVSKIYHGQNIKAVDDISLKLEKGEILSIVGENGSGKTTLIKLIHGLLDADEGKLLFKGKPITGPAYNLVPGHPDMEIVEQSLNLFLKHSIKENILYNLRRFDKEFQSERLQFLLNLFNLQGMEDKIPEELSGGQQQRAALAKALAGDTELLLMDEPFSNLDIMLKDEIKKKVIRTAKEEGITVIFVTHEVKDALSLSDKIAVLKNGRLLQFDTPQKIYEKPANKYVAYLFGNVNIFPAGKFLKIFSHLKGHRYFKNLNQNCQISFRPEHLLLAKEENSQTEGKVKHVSYTGDGHELEVEVKGEILRLSTRKQAAMGDRVYLKIKSSKVHFLND